MKSVLIKKNNNALAGKLSFPGDKSLSHRAIIFGSLAHGISRFTNVLSSEDCVCTRSAFESMGVRIDSASPGELTIHGRGLRALKKPALALDCGNSGTSMRLLSGVLAGNEFEAVLTGDPSLSRRPMGRVTEHLRAMGARIEGRENGNFAPLKIKGGALKGIDAHLKISSAQVKSAIFLAALYARGTTRVTEPIRSRDHTERFLKYFGASLNVNGLTATLEPGKELEARSFAIAGDISSAAFFMALAVLTPQAALEFVSVLDNPTRTGVLEVLKRMGAVFGDYHCTASGGVGGPESLADFSLGFQRLKSFEIKKEELPSLIDEIPILTVLATQAKGTSVIHEADELRVKETDRIHSMVTTLTEMGAKIRVEKNTLFIEGPTPLKGTRVNSFKDHRTAMSLIVAGLIAEGQTRVDDLDCINTSFPDFFELLKKAGAGLEFIDT